MARSSRSRTGQVEVVLGQDSRFAGVTIHSMDGLRRVEDLAGVFDDAYAEAVGSAAPAAGRSWAGKQVTSKPVLCSLPALSAQDANHAPNWQLINDLAAHAGEASGVAGVLGVSENECVQVRLDPASSRGRLTALDQGWLSNAAPSNVTKAITEAFVAAYHKGDKQ